MRAQANEDVGFVKQKPQSQEQMQSKMTVLRWGGRPRKETKQSKEASLADFVKKPKQQKKKATDENVEPNSAQSKAWDVLSMAVAASPATLNHIMQEEQRLSEAGSTKLSSTAKSSKAAGSASKATNGAGSDAPTSRTENNGSVLVSKGQNSSMAAPQGVWSKSGSNESSKKIQGQIQILNHSLSDAS